MQISVSSTLTIYHDGQFWVGLAEHVENGRYGVARIVFGAEPSDEEILQFVTSKWEKQTFFGSEPTEANKPIRNPKRRAREASRALKQPAMSTKAQQVLASQREIMKQESTHTRSQRHAEETEAKDVTETFVGPMLGMTSPEAERSLMEQSVASRVTRNGVVPRVWAGPATPSAAATAKPKTSPGVCPRGLLTSIIAFDQRIRPDSLRACPRALHAGAGTFRI